MSALRCCSRRYIERALPRPEPVPRPVFARIPAALRFVRYFPPLARYAEGTHARSGPKGIQEPLRAETARQGSVNHDPLASCLIHAIVGIRARDAPRGGGRSSGSAMGCGARLQAVPRSVDTHRPGRPGTFFTTARRIFASPCAAAPDECRPAAHQRAWPTGRASDGYATPRLLPPGERPTRTMRGGRRGDTTA